MIERPASDWRAFVVDLDYTDADLASFQRILRQRRNRKADAEWFWWVLGLSVEIGFVVVWAAIALGLADRYVAGVLGVTICAAFWLGVYLPSFVLRRSRRRLEYRQFQEDWRGASLLISPRGVVLRRPHIRSAYGRGAIKTVASKGGLILLWVSANRPLAIPERLLTAEQRANVLAIRAPAALPD